MSKLLIALISLFICHGSTDFPDLSGKIESDRAYIYNVMEPYNVCHRDRVAESIQLYAYYYDHPVQILTRLAETESSFKYWKVNDYSGCIGLLQVSPEWWSHLCWSVRDGKYAKYLNNHKGTNTAEVMKYIGANVQMGSLILRDYVERYGGYEEGLRWYGGFYSRRHRHKTNEMNEYVKKVMQDVQ